MQTIFAIASLPTHDSNYALDGVVYPFFIFCFRCHRRRRRRRLHVEDIHFVAFHVRC